MFRISKIETITNTSRCKAIGSESSLMLFHYIGEDKEPTDMFEYVEAIKTITGVFFKVYYSEEKELYMLYFKSQSTDEVYYKLFTVEAFVKHVRCGDIITLLEPVFMSNVKTFKALPIINGDNCFMCGIDSDVANSFDTYKVASDDKYIYDEENNEITSCITVDETRFFERLLYKGKTFIIRKDMYDKSNFVKTTNNLFISRLIKYKHVNTRDIKDKILINKTNETVSIKEEGFDVPFLADMNYLSYRTFKSGIENGSNLNLKVVDIEKVNEFLEKTKNNIPMHTFINLKSTIMNKITSSSDGCITIDDLLKSLEDNDIYVLYKK